MSQAMLNVALVGNPNCGKTSLFNQLTGTRQKVGNYAGVTVERKEGFFSLPSGQQVRILDLPGTYSLKSSSPDEEVTRRVCLQEIAEEANQDAFLLIADATNLKLNLKLVLEMIALNRPVLLVLNMMDEARRRGININIQRLSERLGIPVVESVATRRSGVENLVSALQQKQYDKPLLELNALDLDEKHHGQQIEDILKDVVSFVDSEDKRTDFLDSIFLHPILGLISLAVLMFVIFQAVFAWAEPFIGWIEEFFAWLGEKAGGALGEGLLSSLVVDGIIAGAGGVVVFLPQILILFFFILVLEESGYLPRAAFLLDKLMFKAGLSGRSFIPLLSSFACAVPGVMAARTISDPRDRLTTIMVAPLMTCSARLPVYALLVGAFIPNQSVGMFNLQGLVLFGLYMGGIVSALCVAFVMKLLRRDKSEHLLMMELPSYRFPNMQSVMIGLLERAKIFLKRVGTIIFALTVLLWVLCTFPQAPENATMPAIDYSFAGMLGHLLQPIFAPIGFNWQIVIALIPAMAAREVVVAALGTVYAMSAVDDEDMVIEGLTGIITQGEFAWTLATGLSLLVWFIYAPHCLSTLATVKRETGSWKLTGIMTAYLFALAYAMSLFTYQIAVQLTS